MPSQSDKQRARLAARVIDYQETVRNPSVKGFRRPGSMNRKKTWPVGIKRKRGR